MEKHYLENLLGEHEKIILVTRQHWFILASSIFLEVILILIIFAVSVTAAVIWTPVAPIIVVIGFILLLVPTATLTRDILNWTNRQFVITNRRVMQIAGIFNKAVIDSSLDKVNDVKMLQSALGRIFGYGDIEILTASELGANLFKRIDEPVRFKTAMINAKERLEREVHDLTPEALISEDIPGKIAKLDNLRKQGVLSEEEFQQKKKELLSKM